MTRRPRIVSLSAYNPNLAPSARDESLSWPEEIHLFRRGTVLAVHPDHEDVSYSSLDELLEDYQIDADHLVDHLVDHLIADLSDPDDPDAYPHRVHVPVHFRHNHAQFSKLDDWEPDSPGGPRPRRPGKSLFDLYYSRLSRVMDDPAREYLALYTGLGGPISKVFVADGLGDAICHVAELGQSWYLGAADALEIDPDSDTLEQDIERALQQGRWVQVHQAPTDAHYDIYKRS